MRHHSNRLIQLSTGQYQSRSNVLRTMLTNLIVSGKIITTPKRAAVLKAYADHFFGRLVWLHIKRPDAAARESVRYIKSVIWTKDAWQKVTGLLLPKYMDQNKTSGFVANHKLGFRKGDGAEEILVTLL